MVPTAADLRRCLEDLVGRPVSLTLGAPLPPTTSRLTTAVYTDQRLATVAVVTLDLAAAARLGAAAGHVPAGVATEAISQDGSLPLLLETPLRGVLEGLTALFPGESLRLYSVVAPGDSVPSDVRATTASLGRRLDVVLDVRAYGAGRVSVVLAR